MISNCFERDDEPYEPETRKCSFSRPVPGGTPAGELTGGEICKITLTVRGLPSDFLPSRSSTSRGN